MPKVSVIIPVYNVEKYLRECLDSVVNQTLKDIEIICVDDGSTDSSLTILKEYAAKDERFIVLAKQNEGAALARNDGLNKASGEFIAFMDPDDFYPNNSILAKLYNLALEKDVKICGGSVEKLKPDGTYMSAVDMEKEYIFESDGYIEYKDYQFDYGYWRFIYNRQFLIANNIEFPNYMRQEDPPFFIKAMVLAKKFYAIKESTYIYRVSYKTIEWTERKSLDIFKGIQDCFQKCLDYNLSILANTIANRINAWTFRTALAQSIKYKTVQEQAIKTLTIINTYINQNNLNIVLDDLYKLLLNSEQIKAFVSVIVPIYNVEKYLPRCLDSIINQTLQNIEIICVNDGSTDGSLEILNEYAAKDKRIKIISQENQGLGAARNSGIKVAQGIYIGFVDSDDWIDENYYESLFKKALFFNADIARCGYIECVDEQCTDSHFNNVIHNACAKNRNLGINEHSVVVWNAIYRKNFLETNKILFENINCAEDIPFTCKTTFLANKIVPVEGSYYYYNQDNPNQLSKMSIEKIFAQLKATQIVINFLNSNNFIKKRDYITAYKRCIWRLDNIFKLGLKEPEFTYEKKSSYLKQFVNIIHEYRYNNDINLFYEIESSLLFLLNDDINSYIDFIIKKQNSIVSLTSYPARINTVHKTIESLLNQTYKAEKIILWLSDIQFPNKEKDLPSSLLKLKEEGLEIGWYHQKEDIKPYNKLINTLKKYPNRVIITADDDIIYNKNCIKSLLDTYTKYPNCIIANRAHYITFKEGKIDKYNNWNFSSEYKLPSFNMFLTGVGTVLYPPNCFYKDILNEDLFMTLAKNTDDIWFWAMAVLKGTKIKLAEPNYSKLNYVDGTQDVGLWKACNENGNNDVNLQKMFKHYPKLLKKLDKDNGFYKNKFEKMFSIKNEGVRKVITIFGIKFKFKSKKLVKRQQEKKKNEKFDKILKSVQAQNKSIKKLQEQISQAAIKLSQQNQKLEQQDNIIKKLNQAEKRLNDRLNFVNRDLMYKVHKYCPNDKYPVALKDWYYERTGKTLNLDNPQTFNEKIQWLKLYDSTPLKTRLADKYLVRDWVKGKIGEEYLIPLIGVWDNFDDIDFDKLPNKFVLKCNHGCGYNIIVKNKSELDINDARKKINNWLNEDFAFRGGLELHYSKIPRKILAEEYIENNENDLYDYKFWCFNGEVKYIQFLSERNTNGLKMAFYDRNWKKQDFVYSYSLDTKIVETPNNIDEMIRLAEILSEGFNHVRVDFYRLDNGQVYFGEMTFTSCSGMCKWEPDSTDLLFGQMFDVTPKTKVSIYGEK